MRLQRDRPKDGLMVVARASNTGDFLLQGDSRSLLTGNIAQTSRWVERLVTNTSHRDPLKFRDAPYHEHGGFASNLIPDNPCAEHIQIRLVWGQCSVFPLNVPSIPRQKAMADGIPEAFEAVLQT